MGKDKGRLSVQRQAEEERHAALMAVAHSLTAAEREQFLAKASHWRGLPAGADVADVLDMTTDHDEFLDQTEPFYEAHTDLPGMPGVIFALHVLIILGQKLTVPAVLRLLLRAGLLDTAHEGEVRNLIVEEVADDLQRSWNLAHGTSATAPRLDDQMAAQLARHAIARLALIRDRDGIDPLTGQAL